ncbi:MAG: glycosyltransferase family 2 protein [Burkholderiales bacterium]
MSVSVIVITKNEADVIERCLRSVDWADEVIVLDSGSTDRTVEISRGLGARVSVTADWPGFGPQKNRALAQATGDWVLSLDADEWVTPELRDEILNVITRTDGTVAFRVPRLSSFCGRFMRHSGWWPDYVTRLFFRGAARFSDDVVHERVIVEGKAGTLRELIMHETFVDLDELLQKMNNYSSLAAQEMRHGGRKAGLAGAVLRGLWAFIRTYFLRGGFLDGREGFMLAVATAEGTYYRYAKLMLLDKK